MSNFAVFCVIQKRKEGGTNDHSGCRIDSSKMKHNLLIRLLRRPAIGIAFTGGCKTQSRIVHQPDIGTRPSKHELKLVTEEPPTIMTVSSG